MNSKPARPPADQLPPEQPTDRVPAQRDRTSKGSASLPAKTLFEMPVEALPRRTWIEQRINKLPLAEPELELLRTVALHDVAVSQGSELRVKDVTASPGHIAAQLTKPTPKGPVQGVSDTILRERRKILERYGVLRFVRDHSSEPSEWIVDLSFLVNLPPIPPGLYAKSAPAKTKQRDLPFVVSECSNPASPPVANPVPERRGRFETLLAWFETVFRTVVLRFATVFQPAPVGSEPRPPQRIGGSEPSSRPPYVNKKSHEESFIRSSPHGEKSSSKNPWPFTVTRKSLRNGESVGKLYVRAIQRGWLDDSPGLRVQFIAACAVCSEAKRPNGHKTHPDEDVGRLFTWFVKNRKWEQEGQISCEAIDLAKAQKSKMDAVFDQFLKEAESRTASKP